MNTKDNRKARLSREIFHQSLLEIMDTKSVYKISVTELCAHAEMNRSTFYAHYETIYDLLQEIENDIYERMKAALEEYKPWNASALVHYYQYIYENGSAFLRLIEQDVSFRARILASATSLYSFPETLGKYDDPEDVSRFKLNYIAGGSLYAIEQWLSSSHPITPEQMTEYMLRFASSILKPNHFSK